MPYVYSPPALYDLTRDEGDATQLTDGKLAPDTMWMSRQAVGWLAGAAPIEIEIDLRAVKPVGKVCLRSARRAEAGVSFPRRVDIFASTDREHYSWIGNLMAGQEAGEGPYLAKNFCSSVIRREVRYIRLLVATKGSYFFSDEVEVWPPAEAMPAIGSDANHSAPLALSELKVFALEHEVVSRMAESLVQRPARGTPPSALTDRLRNVMRGLGDNSGALGLEHLASLEREMWQVVRQERIASGHVLDIRLADPWRLATPLDAAPYSSAAEEVDMPQGGHTAIALAVEHAEEQPLRVSVTAEVLSTTKNVLRLNLLEVAMVTRANGVRQGDPLLPLINGAFEVASGESRQLWLDVAAPGGTTGRYTVRLRFEVVIGGRPISRLLDIPMRVWTVAPPPLSPSIVVWGYLDSPPLRGLSKAASADMLAHGVTTAVLPAADLPWPKPGAPVPGNSIGDYRKFEKVMEALKGHRQYLFFLGFNSDSSIRTFGRQHPFLSDAWKALFTDWIKEWSTRLKQSGIGYDAFAFYPVDEPQKGAEQEALIAIARLIKATDPSIRVYTTLVRPEVLSDEMLKIVDIFQLAVPALTPTMISKLKERGKQVWAYAAPVEGGKAGNPASFYRAQAWEAFALGLSGFGFWAYADVGQSGTAWNDTDGVRPDYAVIYEGHPGIISSKRWEAWREGVQDFALLSVALANARTTTERQAVNALAAEGRQALGDSAKFAKIRRKLFELASTRGTSNPPK